MDEIYRKWPREDIDYWLITDDEDHITDQALRLIFYAANPTLVSPFLDRYDAAIFERILSSIGSDNAPENRAQSRVLRDVSTVLVPTVDDLGIKDFQDLRSTEQFDAWRNTLSMAVLSMQQHDNDDDTFVFGIKSALEVHAAELQASRRRFSKFFLVTSSTFGIGALTAIGLAPFEGGQGLALALGSAGVGSLTTGAFEAFKSHLQDSRKRALVRHFDAFLKVPKITPTP